MTNDQWVRERVQNLAQRGFCLNVPEAISVVAAALQEAIERGKAETQAALTVERYAGDYFEESCDEWRARAEAAEAKLAEERAHATEALRLAHEMQDNAVEKAREEDGEWCRALLRVVQANPGFDWHDYEEGIEADQAAQFLIDDLNEAWSLQDKAVAAERERCAKVADTRSVYNKSLAEATAEKSMRAVYGSAALEGQIVARSIRASILTEREEGDDG